MILVDTSVWVAYLRDAPVWQVETLDRHIDGNDLLLGDLVLCEVLRGLPDEDTSHEVDVLLRQCPMVTICNPDLAVEAARNFRLLRAKGITIRGTIDLLIGTFCIAHGHAVLHRDRDFDAMERHLGLRVVRA